MTSDPEIAGIPHVGEVLVGKYRVERVLGVGGMGVVVAATHLQLDEKVAIKMLHEEVGKNADLVARFLREGKSVIKIRSEHAVKVHDVGMLPSGAPYLVMEHLDGQDLSELLKRRGRFPIAEAVDLVLQACEAIAEAHGLGIVHRDLKPANLFLTHRADGTACVKVLDFGISKAAQVEGQELAMTKTQTVMGSPLYMSPEQMRSTRNVDARADIWALGVILYELFSGAPPFTGGSMTEVCAQILQDVQAPIAPRRTDVPPALDAWLNRCLAKNPGQRFANLAEFAGALAPFGTPAALASAQRIGRVLAKARPGGPNAPPGGDSTQVIDGSSSDLATNPNMASSGSGTVALSSSDVSGPLTASGNQAGGPWGTATGKDATGVLAPKRQSSSGLAIAILIGLVLLGAAGVVGLVFLRRDPTPTAALPAASTTAIATAPTAPPEAVPPSVPADVPAATATPAPTETAAPTATAPSVATKPKPNAGTHPAGSKPAKPDDMFNGRN